MCGPLARPHETRRIHSRSVMKRSGTCSLRSSLSFSPDRNSIMLRRVFVLALGLPVLAAAISCRAPCGNGHGWFTSVDGSAPSYRLTGRTDPCDTCNQPPVGAPVPGWTGAPGGEGMLIPSAGPPGAPTVELPMPAPAAIPRQTLPPGPPPTVPSSPPLNAVPGPAPPPSLGEASVLPPPKFGVPVGNR